MRLRARNARSGKFIVRSEGSLPHKAGSSLNHPGGDPITRKTRILARLKNLNLDYLHSHSVPLRLKIRRLIGRSQFAGIQSHLLDREGLKSEFEYEYSRFYERLDSWKADRPEYLNQSINSIDKFHPLPRRILVLSPHPDDEIIGCGGTILKYVDEGIPVTVVQLTDGSNCAAVKGASHEYAATARLREATKVANYLGISDLRLWAIPERQYATNSETEQMMDRLLEELKPDLIFLPFINDLHTDHVHTNRVLARSLSRRTSQDVVTICSYETWSIVPANCFVDITGTFTRKANALALYPIPMKVVDYITFCARRDAMHHWDVLNSFGFAENFLALESPAYLALISKHFGGMK